jgi:hypothetical protein
MTKEEKTLLREKFRLWSIEVAGGCSLQEGEDGEAYPCGTCFNAGLGELITEYNEEYNGHNDEPDRINEVWRFLLQLRDENYEE